MAESYEVDQAVIDGTDGGQAQDGSQQMSDGQQAPELGTAAPGQQPQQAAPAWDGKQFALKFRDKEIVPENRDKLINWAQLGYSYDKRAGDLKQREEQIARQSQEYQQYAQIAKAFETNPSFKQQILNMYYQALNGGAGGGALSRAQQGDAPGAQAAIPPQLMETVNGLQQRLSVYEQQQADQALNREVETLKGKYGNVDFSTPSESGQTLIDEVFDMAHKMGGVPLEVAFRNLHYEKAIENAKAEALANAQAAKAKGGGVVPQGRPAPGKPKPVNPASMSYDELARSVISGNLQ